MKPHQKCLRNKQHQEIAMKNKMTDLHNHLFAQLERLSDEELKGDGLKEEVERSKAVTAVAREIIANGSLVLKARRAIQDREIGEELPPMLEG